MTVLVTGSAGFVGSALIRKLRGDGFTVRELRRTGNQSGETIVADLSEECDLKTSLVDVEAIIHCAARVHMMNDSHADPLGEFRKMNRDATLRLASQAAKAGVRRFIFLSSIKVNGEATGSRPFTPDEQPHPVDPYGISKAEAEDRLRSLAAETGLDVVIVRPPLVYGPGVRANFAALISLLRRRLPLPLGSVTKNRRSMIAIDNLVDFLSLCLKSSAAANQTFLVSDGEDLSTADLLRRLGRAMGAPARLPSVPAAILRLAATILGRRAAAQRLLGSLQVDISKARTLLGWEPPVSTDEGLRRAVSL